MSLLALVSCSDESQKTLPPLATIEAATLRYANCVDQSARELAGRPASIEQLAQEAVANCSALRSVALELKGVPVMYPTTVEFDAAHLGLARNTLIAARGKNSNAPNS